MAHEPTQRPNPVASGGTRQAAAFWSLRSNPAGSVRQPDLGSPPRVASASGFGAGSGATIMANGAGPDQSQGLVRIKVGTTPAASGIVVLAFPAGIVAGQYWFAADWATLNPAPPGGGGINVGWTATRPLVSGEILSLAYQWAIST